MRNIFINQRDMIRLLIEQPPVFILPPGATSGRNTWALNIENMPAGGIARVRWDLPVAAQTVFVQWAWESTASKMLLQMQLMDNTTGNYIFVRHYPDYAGADHTVRKFIGGVETVLLTEPVDLIAASPYEYSFLFDVNRPRPNGLGFSFYHSYRARGNYQVAATADDLVYRERLFGDPLITSAQIGRINRVEFVAQNNDPAPQRVGILQVHFDTTNPLVIAYDTV